MLAVRPHAASFTIGEHGSEARLGFCKDACKAAWIQAFSTRPPSPPGLWRAAGAACTSSTRPRQAPQPLFESSPARPRPPSDAEILAVLAISARKRMKDYASADRLRAEIAAKTMS